MYTLQRVLELTRLPEDFCYVIYKRGRYVDEGILSDLLHSDTGIRIERFSLEIDDYGLYLLLYIA